MNDLGCRQARALVSDYIDGELDAEVASALERHLQSCPSCPPLYASLVATLADLKAAESPTGGFDDLVRRVVAGIKSIGPSGVVDAPLAP